MKYKLITLFSMLTAAFITAVYRNKRVKAEDRHIMYRQPSFTTTMPVKGVTYEEWKQGKWNEYINPAPRYIKGRDRDGGK